MNKSFLRRAGACRHATTGWKLLMHRGMATSASPTWLVFTLLTITLLSGCGKKETTETVSTKQESINLAEAQAYKHPLAEAYYKENPDFFRYATLADIPTDLTWEDGMEQAEFASPEAKKGGTVTIWITDFPRTLRLVGPDANGSFRGDIGDNQNVSTVHKHPITGNYFPGLASSWAITADRKTVYLKLDPDARYSDGVPVIADDYFFLFYFMRSPHLTAPWYFDWYHKKYTNITRYDDHTISVSLTDQKPDTLRFIEGVRPIPRHFYKDFGPDYVQRYQWLLEPTTGPYTIHDKDIKKGRSITQTRLKDWWAKDKKFWRYRFNPDKRKFVVIREEAKAIESFKRGEIDYFRLNIPKNWYEKVPDDLPEVKNGYIHKTQFYNDVPRPSFALWINKAKPLLDNKDIRQGIQYATNWDLVIKTYFRGDYERMQTTTDGYGDFSHPTLKSRKFSIEKAKEHFAKAGFNQVDTDGILKNAQGQRLSFTITTGYKNRQDALTILAQESAKAGLEYKLEVLDSTTGWKKAQEKKHEITFAALNTAAELYPRYWEFWHSYNGYNEDGTVKVQTNNLTSTGDPEFDRLIDAYNKSIDLEEIKQIAHTLEELLYDDASFVPAFVRPWYRMGYWRWIRWPEGFNVKLSRDATEFNLYWIDEAMKEETQTAKKSGKTFPSSIQVFDQYHAQRSQ